MFATVVRIMDSLLKSFFFQIIVQGKRLSCSFVNSVGADDAKFLGFSCGTGLPPGLDFGEGWRKGNEKGEGDDQSVA